MQMDFGFPGEMLVRFVQGFHGSHYRQAGATDLKVKGVDDGR